MYCFDCIDDLLENTVLAQITSGAHIQHARGYRIDLMKANDDNLEIRIEFKQLTRCFASA